MKGAGEVGNRYRLIVAAFLGVALLFAGGASRYDEDLQILVRLAAIVAIAASLWPLDFAPLRRRPGLAVAAGVVWLLVALHLVPLPPDLWARLPGHEVYAKIAAEAGVVGWRPLSLTPDLTLNALFALLPATAAGLCALYLDHRSRLRLAGGVVLAACVSGALGLAQLALGGEALRLYRETSLDSAVGLFANRNHQAVFLACALPLVGAVAVAGARETENLGRVLTVALPVVAFLLLALVAAQSRMGLLLGAVGLLGAAAVWRVGGFALLPSSRSLRMAAAAGGAALLAAVGLAVAAGGLLERFTTVGPTTETRIATLPPMLATAKAFMPLGAGFGAFDSVYRRFEPDALLSTVYMNQAHNEPLQLAIEGGLPALALMVVFGWWWAKTAARASGAREQRPMALAAVATTAILLLSSLVDYPLRTPLLGALFAIACVEMVRAARAEGPS